jgi:hypothetical protein
MRQVFVLLPLTASLCFAQSSALSAIIEGVNTQTTSYTINASDNQSKVAMNCSTACTVTLPNPPSRAFAVEVVSLGTVTPSVSIGSLKFNGTTTPPTLSASQQPSRFYTDGTNWFGTNWASLVVPSFRMSRPGLQTGQSTFYNQNNVNGCDPVTEQRAVNPEFNTSVPLAGCVTSNTPTPQELIGLVGYASSNGGTAAHGEAVGGMLQGRILGSTGYAFGAAVIAGATSELTKNGTLVGEEIDLSPESATTSFASGVGLQIIGGTFYKCKGCTGTWPFTGITIGTSPSGSLAAGTAQHFKQGITFSRGGFGYESTLLNADAVSTATANANYGSPGFVTLYDTYWDPNTSASRNNSWRMQAVMPGGPNPGYDEFYIKDVNDGLAENSRMVHHFTFDAASLVDLAWLRSDGSFSSVVPTHATGASVVFTLPAASGVGGFGLAAPNGTATFTPGAGVTSVVCSTGYSCTNTRGELTIVGGAATTGTIATVAFSTALPAPPGLCSVTQNGGSASYMLGHGIPTTSSVTITAGASISGARVTADYYCVP